MKNILLLLLSSILFLQSSIYSASPLNLLIITVDDMSADSVGTFGCKLPDTTPNIDKLAAQGLRFQYAHVQVGNCMPVRNVMWSGLYPHNNGVEGFYKVPDAKHPHLVDLMKQGGYFTGIRNKVAHSTPYTPYGWDLVLDTTPSGKKAHVKDAKSYRLSVERGIQAARSAKKPFCLMMNISDPHKPFYAQGRGGATIPDPNVPTRVFKSEEVPVPGFLFDDPVVRKELAHYYSSVRRADDCVGQILAGLQASGEANNTLILFLSDHGMPLPFAKTQLYHHSTRTPLIVVWPGVTQPGSVDETHMVSTVDFLPTLLDVSGIENPGTMDGRSFADLIKGGTQENRDHVVKEYNENSGASRDPMRAIQTQRFLYIFNAWSNGKRVMATATTGTQTYRRMAKLAESNPELAARNDLYRHRVVEELYDVQNDPDCLRNLADNSAYENNLKNLVAMLDSDLAETGDPILEAFRARHDATVREAYVVAEEKIAEARKAATRKARRKAAR